MQKKQKTSNAAYFEFKLSEDPFLLDDPGGSPLEWLELSSPCLREAVRLEESRDPWARPSFGAESDALTEHRRRKLQHLSLIVEERWDDSVA